jgi:hypothetical protein
MNYDELSLSEAIKAATQPTFAMTRLRFTHTTQPPTSLAPSTRPPSPHGPDTPCAVHGLAPAVGPATVLFLKHGTFHGLSTWHSIFVNAVETNARI